MLTMYELRIVLISVIEHINCEQCKIISQVNLINSDESHRKCSEYKIDGKVSGTAVNERDGLWRPP